MKLALMIVQMLCGLFLIVIIMLQSGKSSGLSGAIGGIMGGMGSKVSVIPLWLTLAALAFATFIGVISGYSPAQRAMNLSVLEGLKNE